MLSLFQWTLQAYTQINKDEVTQFIEQANSHHPTIKFTAEISDSEATFLDTKAKDLQNSLDWTLKLISKLLKHFNQYTHFSRCHPPGVKKGLIKGKAL